MVSNAEPKIPTVDMGVVDSAPRKKKRAKVRWSSFSYTTRMTLAFAFIAAMTALVAIGVVSFVWEQHFQTYTADNMETLADTTANRIADNYEHTGDLWNPDTTKPAAQATEMTSGVGYTADNMETLADTTANRIADNYEHTGDLWNPDTTKPAAQATEMTSGVGVKVIDAQGGVPYDSSITAGKESGGLQKSFEPKDSSQVAMANIIVDGKAIGSVHIWVYGSDTLMRQPDQEFRNNSYQAMLLASVVAMILASCIGYLFARNLVAPINCMMLLASVVAMILASCIGYLFARNLVAPINCMTKTARAIKEGDLSARTDLHGEDEIARLGETFDAMAESVEKDRELERRLTTDVAHELRTPLMAIQATVEAMVDGVYEADEERLVTVNSEVQRLSAGHGQLRGSASFSFGRCAAQAFAIGEQVSADEGGHRRCGRAHRGHRLHARDVRFRLGPDA